MISTLTLFVPPTGPQLFQAFGLPLILADAASAEMPSARHHIYDEPLPGAKRPNGSTGWRLSNARVARRYNEKNWGTVLAELKKLLEK